MVKSYYIFLGPIAVLPTVIQNWPSVSCFSYRLLLNNQEIFAFWIVTDLLAPTGQYYYTIPWTAAQTGPILFNAKLATC